jgi:hypothetical protein
MPGWLPFKRIVDRVLAWLGKYPRLSDDHEELVEYKEVMIRFMLQRLCRPANVRYNPLLSPRGSVEWEKAMNVRPNETQVKATVKQIVPCSDGQGYDVDLEISENQTSDLANDFLQPKQGDQLKVYTAEAGKLSAGQQIHATLALSGGPFQQRTILRRSNPVKP